MSNERRFLFLQGPHGPFFYRLGQMLHQTGAQVWRVGFNFGDRAMWPESASFIASHASAEDWPAQIRQILAEKAITDLVLYGDTRPVHAAAVLAARAAGITIHVFEEGYMRPYWITYERGGANGHSRLMELTMAEIRAAAEGPLADQPEAPTHWGDLRQHMFWGAAYHFMVWLGRGKFPAFRPHRDLTLLQEFRLHLIRLLAMPFHKLNRLIRTLRIKRAGYPYHLALLQLEHDASFRAHSSFASMTEFLAAVIDGFAKGAPQHHHLVFKAHPLEDGRTPLARDILRLAEAAGISTRVHFVPGGKLAVLLDTAQSAVTVNSTAGQQALWRGLPLKALGTAVYGKPGLVSDQPLTAFFAAPERPDPSATRAFRRFLLLTSQVPGGYYAQASRGLLLRQVTDRLLSQHDPYAAILAPPVAAQRQHLRLLN